MTQTTDLGGFHPVFDQALRSRWSILWTMRHTAVAAGDGQTAAQRTKCLEARSVEFIAPIDTTGPGPALTADLGPAIVSLAATLRGLGPDLPADTASWLLLQADAFDFRNLAAVLDLHPEALHAANRSVDAAARVLEAMEGQTHIARDGSGFARETAAWLALSEGDALNVSDLPASDVLPAALLDEVLGTFEARMDLQLTRSANRAHRERTYAAYEGSGTLALSDGLRAELTAIEMRIDVTDPKAAFLHQLSFGASLPPAVLGNRRRFAGVTWEGDLTLSVLYLAVPGV